MSKKTFTFIIVVVLALIGGVYYWFFMRNTSPNVTVEPGTNPTTSSTGFSTFSRPGPNTAVVTSADGNSGNTGNSTSTAGSAVPIPALRELSTTPVGGMAASTTASTTLVRWIDRGAGHVFQASSDSLTITELSNTTVPSVYETYWDKNTTDFILRSLTQGTDNIVNFYATLYRQNATGTTQYELRGTSIPSDVTALAVSPQGNSLFTLEKDSSTSNNGGSIGYTSQFDGTKKVEVLSTPLTDLNIEWPESNTIAITTKGSSSAAGDLYFLNAKTGAMSPILSGVRGLDTLTSKDASTVLFTTTIDGGIQTSMYDVKTGNAKTLLFNTMPAEKCVWSNLQKNIFYCAVPFQIPTADYPDAWYQGTVSFSDSILEVNAATGETHTVSDLSKTAGVNIDATNLVLDPHENYLYFINKNNLTLWSLELNG